MVLRLLAQAIFKLGQLLAQAGLNGEAFSGGQVLCELRALLPEGLHVFGLQAGDDGVPIAILASEFYFRSEVV